jgi:hypothetical protein
MTAIAVIVGIVILCVNIGFVILARWTAHTTRNSTAKLPRRRAYDLDDPAQRHEFERLPH